MKKKQEPVSNRKGVNVLTLHKETLRLLEEGTDMMHVVGGTRVSAGPTGGANTCCFQN